jgi:transcriptional regulator with XRE-family HTH domain
MEAETSSRDKKKAIHLGRNTQRIREILGIKQSTLAANTGFSQQYISKLERSQSFADEVIEKLASGLGVQPDLIKNFDEERAINIISNNSFENCAQPASFFYNATINPIEQLMAALDENKKLYEALLQSEKEKNALLEKLLANNVGK